MNKLSKYTKDEMKKIFKFFHIPFGGNCCDGALDPVGFNPDGDTLQYYDRETNTYITITSGGGNPAAPLRSVQFNNAGAFGGDSNFTFSVYDDLQQGLGVLALGGNSHAQGVFTQALGAYSHAEGTDSVASGDYSHAEGFNTYANGEASHAEGIGSKADSQYSHAEGFQTYALAAYAHSEGEGTIATKVGAHAEGHSTQANGSYSHSEGDNTEAWGDYSHAGGIGTYVGATGGTVVGRYNNIDGMNILFAVGGGADNLSRQDAFRVYNSKQVYINLDEYATNADAVTAGLGIGYLYRTGDDLKIVH